jgi:hypothetical protein
VASARFVGIDVVLNVKKRRPPVVDALVANFIQHNWTVRGEFPDRNEIENQRCEDGRVSQVPMQNNPRVIQCLLLERTQR